MEDQNQSSDAQVVSEASQPTQESNTVDQHFDYRKAREERIIRSTEKRILKDLGEESFEDIKLKLEEKQKLQKELELQKTNGLKLNVYSQGFDDQFVDFIAHDVSKKLKDGETFEDALKRYKKDHPQFLRASTKIKFNTSPDFENKQYTHSSHQMMNDFFRGRLKSLNK